LKQRDYRFHPFFLYRFGQFLSCNPTITLEFDSQFVGKNPTIKIPNDQNHGWSPLFELYEFATRKVRHRWFFSVGEKDRMVQVNGNNGGRK
jgi:hypothetical protein